MSDSNRELLLESFKTMLSKITLFNGFESEVTRAERKMMAYDDPTVSFPILMVLGGGETYEDELGSYTKSTLSVRIRGYTKDETDPEEALNKLIKDVLLILDNPVYNSYHSKYRPIRLDTDEGWMNLELAGLAMFELVVELVYRFKRDNP